MTTTTDTLIDGVSPYKITGETPEQAENNAIRAAREAGEFRIGDAAGFATRNLRITRDAYLGGDNLRGVLVEFDACGMMGSDIKRPTPNGNYAPRRLRLVVQ